MKKRLLALFLAAFMMVGLLPITVFATPTSQYHYTTYENWQIKHEGSEWQWTGNLTKVEDGLFKMPDVQWKGSGFNVASDANPIKKDWYAPEDLTIGEELIALVPITVDVYLRVIDDETLKIGVGVVPYAITNGTVGSQWMTDDIDDARSALANRILNYVSSNFPTAESVGATAVSHSYGFFIFGGSYDGFRITQNYNRDNYDHYYTASDTETLAAAFKSISTFIESGGTTVKLNETAVIRDIVSDYFRLPDGATVADIVAYTSECIGYDAVNEKFLFQDEADWKVATDVKVTLNDYVEGDEEVDNRDEFQNASGVLDWQFKVEAFPREPDDPVSPPTGDNFRSYIWIIVLVASAALAVFLIILLRRKNKDDDDE